MLEGSLTKDSWADEIFKEKNKDQPFNKINFLLIQDFLNFFLSMLMTEMHAYY
ncbi:unnamed protein product [Paramecium pentaurelia]|uniref:Uncharacterized protein n=1 Tax=Paramecium pentaurelia TaxID=43138 RepID=A0A8S1YIV2_9CILI|nr:unnamed protein product [Paramecium pentaurelia]